MAIRIMLPDLEVPGEKTGRGRPDDASRLGIVNDRLAFPFRVLILLANGFEVHGRRGHLKIEPFQVVHDKPGHREVAKPLAVGGEDEPRRPLRATAGQGVLVGFGVGVPALALLNDATRQLSRFMAPRT
jgi:hypothetical protein